jgi:predicted acetylornithine/succinylornithine family transaminase
MRYRTLKGAAIMEQLAPTAAPEAICAQQVIEWYDEYAMRTYRRLPVVFIRGEGAYLWDADGRRYLDLESGGRAGNALGHGNPTVAKAVSSLAASMPYLSNDFYHYYQGRLAKELAETSRCKRAFFVNSGAEANECAIKLARKWAHTSRGIQEPEIITMEGSFHGRTLATITATGQPKFQKGFEPLPRGFRYVPFNNAQALQDAISPSTAAIMMEPVLGESGVYPATHEFVSAARRLCDEHKLLLIFDEVQTGVGRTGRFWAHEHYGVQPDIITNAKTLGGGLPIGVCLATEDVSAAFGPGDHGCTFGGNPISCAAALAALQHIRENSLVTNAEQVGSVLRHRLTEVAARTDAIAEVRGLGLMIGVDLKQPIAPKVVLKGLEEGLILNSSSDFTLRILPPLVLTEEQAEQAASSIERILVMVGGAA